ncbi:hypothetical protein QYE76_042372 [Lolium multiflorum]|uniref:Uncharacterized protein n=1 Tax=Lolium multiflorum TaxID=4521 RepID=A0AAD8TGU1_LOLMU|nr:hypothetical protein QYE76_042372 [Lolium multiflorum]
MGKKKSVSTSGTTKVSRDWGASTISNHDVSKLRALGFISSSDDDIRLPVFLKRRVQPLMSRPHQLWLYTGEEDKSRVSSANLSDDDLHDEVRRLTCYSMKDTIVLTSARSPYDLTHLPAEASTVTQCYPPTPESAVEPEDDDHSEETEDAQHALEDSDVQEEEAPEDDALTRSRQCRRINDDLITTAESSPSGQDNDADETASPPPAPKSSASFFAVEDDLDLSDDDDDVPLAKRPIYATVDAVADFAEQFTRLESENAHLRKTIKTSADQVLEAKRLATDAQNENILLKDEMKKLKQKMKDEQDAKRKAAIAADEKEGILRESIANLMGAADLSINRARKLREDSMIDALSLADSFVFFPCRSFFESFG